MFGGAGGEFIYFALEWDFLDFDILEPGCL